MGHAGGTLDERLRVAVAHCDGRHLELVDHLSRRRQAVHSLDVVPELEGRA